MAFCCALKDMSKRLARQSGRVRTDASENKCRILQRRGFKRSSEGYVERLKALFYINIKATDIQARQNIYPTLQTGHIRVYRDITQKWTKRVSLLLQWQTSQSAKQSGIIDG